MVRRITISIIQKACGDVNSSRCGKLLQYRDQINDCVLLYRSSGVKCISTEASYSNVYYYIGACYCKANSYNIEKPCGSVEPSRGGRRVI